MKNKILLLSFILLAVSTQSASAQKFNSKQCLDAKFDTSIKHEGKFFGLIKNELNIKKSQCIINIKFKNILETSWLIDICREPIHIKVTSKGSQSVFKRVDKCEKNDPSDYCTFWQELYDTLQDYGLIFAEGERESLTSAHGQTYCTHLILKRYLSDGYLFSKYDMPKNIFNDSSAQAVITAPSSPNIIEQSHTLPVKEEDSVKPMNQNDIESKADELIESSEQF